MWHVHDVHVHVHGPLLLLAHLRRHLVLPLDRLAHRVLRGAHLLRGAPRLLLAPRGPQDEVLEELRAPVERPRVLERVGDEVGLEPAEGVVPRHRGGGTRDVVDDEHQLEAQRAQRELRRVGERAEVFAYEREVELQEALVLRARRVGEDRVAEAVGLRDGAQRARDGEEELAPLALGEGVAPREDRLGGDERAVVVEAAGDRPRLCPLLGHCEVVEMGAGAGAAAAGGGGRGMTQCSRSPGKKSVEPTEG